MLQNYKILFEKIIYHKERKVTQRFSLWLSVYFVLKIFVFSVPFVVNDIYLHYNQNTKYMKELNAISFDIIGCAIKVHAYCLLTLMSCN